MNTKGLLFKLTALIMALTFVFVIVFSYYSIFQGLWVKNDYKQVAALFDLEDMSISGTGVMSRFLPLLEQNEHTSGFVHIPNTGIQYPVMQTIDNPHYYSNHDFGKKGSRFGTPYFNENNLLLIDNFNYIIYGNNTNDGQMFSDLTKYAGPDYYANAPVVYMSTLFEEHPYKIFAAFVADSDVDYQRTGFYDADEFLLYAAEARMRSLITTPVEVEENDSLLTLVCPYGEYSGARFVVLARRVREMESVMDSYESATVQENPLMPKRWYTLKGLPQPEYQSKFVLEKKQDPPESTTTSYDTVSSEPETVSSEPVSSRTSLPQSSSKASVTSSKKPSSSSSKVPSISPSKPIEDKPGETSVPSSTPSAVAPPVTLGNLTVSNSTGQKITGTPEVIISQIVEAEIGGSFETEALKAQAVAAYSYFLANGAASGSAPYSPLKTPTTKTTNAVKSVLGKVVTYKDKDKDKVAATYFYAMSAGFTALPQDIWNSSLGYLTTSVESKEPVDNPNVYFESEYTITAADLAKKLSVDLNAVPDHAKLVTITKKDARNLYVVTVNIATKGSQKGNSFRSSVGSTLLRSPAFDIQYNEENDSFTFSVKGFGHGVGMSQRGANEYAKLGWTYDRILNHYFQNIKIEQVT